MFDQNKYSLIFYLTFFILILSLIIFFCALLLSYEINFVTIFCTCINKLLKNFLSYLTTCIP
uniref:Uncharacterized protein n=1 Tax=Chondria sp. (in: red algae) TaxID=1982705 RepID=A0A1Z1ME15_9FLOR|nr:hypothetical protein [Chondria sp. (in: red algae)]